MCVFIYKWGQKALKKWHNPGSNVKKMQSHAQNAARIDKAIRG